jgi:hypothetical protein
MTIVGGIIASRVEVSGTGTINIPKVSGTNLGYYTPKRVTLVD